MSDNDEVFSAIVSRLREYLAEKEMEVMAERPIDYGYQLRLADGGVVNVYTTGKVVFAGKETPFRRELQSWYESWAGPATGGKGSAAPQLDERYVAHIGGDEAGKGDYFGPLVVGAVYVDEAAAGELIALGVRDSKAMSDRRIEELALEIRARCPNQVEILLPAEYNERYEKAGNLNRLLADLFATAIGKLVMETECNRVLVDRFARGNVLSHVLSLRLGELELEERPRAESDVAVAAASILAREAFVASIKDFRVKSGLDIPLGATNSDVVPVAKEIVKRWGAEGLRRSVKMHFKTTRKVL